MACAGVINGVRIEPTSNSPNSVHSMMRTEFPLSARSGFGTEQLRDALHCPMRDRFDAPLSAPLVPAAAATTASRKCES